MKDRNRMLSIVVSVLMIFSMLVCGMDQTAFAAQNEENGVAVDELNTENISEGETEGTVQEESSEEDTNADNSEKPKEDAKAGADEETAGEDDPGTAGTVEVVEDVDAEEETSTREGPNTKRTIMLYDVGSNLETEAGLASYNLRQILASSFSSDDDIKFIVMTGGSYRWQLDDDDVKDNANNCLVFPDGVNVPDDAGLQRDPYDKDYHVELPKKSVISGVYNQLWEAKGIDAAENKGKLVLLDGDGITGEEGQTVRSEDELMSDPETLKAFINYCVENYPADNYDLILWDHGGGPAGGFGADEHYEYKAGTSEIMSFEGLVEAFSDNAVTDNDKKFDFIDFDACLMNSVELALTMADYTDYYIASAETEPGYGQYYGPRDGRYTGWLDLLGTEPDHDTFDLGKVIVDDFYNFYEKEEGDGASQDGTLAVVDTKKMMDSQFVNTLIALVRVLRNEAANAEEDGIHFYDELKSYYNSIEYGGSELFDLGQVASLLSVVNSEVGEKDLDKEDDYYINCNSYHDISRTIINFLYDDSESAFMYKRGTSGIRSKENYYRTKNDTLGYGSLGTSGMSIYFPGLDYVMSGIDYFEEIDPVIDRMADGDKRKEFLQDYEEAIAYYSLILYSGRTISRLINDEDDDLEIADKSEVDYDLFMSVFRNGFFSMWGDLAEPAMEKMPGVGEDELCEWLRVVIAQQVDDAIEGNKVTIEKLGEDESGACKVIVNDARKSIVSSVERNIYAELPIMEAYLKTLTPQEQVTAEKWANTSLGTVKGRLKGLPDSASVAEKIRWYNESGGEWDVDALEDKWYAISDSGNALHVASFYLVDEDGFYAPALIETDTDIPPEDRMVFLEFSNKESDGDVHALTSIWFVDADEGPVKSDLKELTGELTITPILWIRPFMAADIYAPISTSFTLSSDNASDIILKYMDVEQIGDIRDTDGDGRVLDSSITITNIYGYPITVSDRTHIKYARLKPGIYTGEELAPEIVYQGETLQAGVDYILQKESVYDPEAGFVDPEFIEPGDYNVYLTGKGLFKGKDVLKTFRIVLPEEAAASAVEEARTAVEEAQKALNELGPDASDEDVLEAYRALVEAQQALTDAQDALARTMDALSAEEQAALQDEIDKLNQDIHDLNDQLAEAQVVDISNYAITLSGTSFEYTGKAITPSVTVSGLSADDFTVEYANNIKIGTATVTVNAKGDRYKGSIKRTFTITKRTNTLAASGKTATVKYKKLRKKAQKLAVSKVVKFSNKGNGTMTYTKASGNKKITINKKTGKVTIKKKLKKGTYTVKVTITAAGNATYKKATKTVTNKV